MKTKEKEANDSIDKILDKLLRDFFNKPDNRKTIAQGAKNGKATF